MGRVFNFSAGPSMLPEPVLQRASEEMLDYRGSGQSVMEMSHRSKVYEEILFSCVEKLRSVLSIPSNYKVLLVQGGASSQFAMVPMNLMNGSGRADYAVTGQFAKKAFKEGARYGAARAIVSSEDRNFTYIPEVDLAAVDAGADYFHICSNNTIYGSRWIREPETGSVPLVADMSSCILSQPVDVSKYGLIYAGAQKNMGPAGLTCVIIREDLIGRARPDTPTMFDYKTFADSDSMYNTPPCYAIYVCGLVLEWLEGLGGLTAMQAINERKAKKLYDAIDASPLFRNDVEKPFRSLMNVPFVTGDEALDKLFVKEAEAEGFVNLKGHRSVGGMRASIYNAMPEAGIDKLVGFMKEFEKKHV